MQLAAWLLVCVGLSVAFLRHSSLGLRFALILWLFVPSAAGDLLTGVSAGSGAPALHPASWLVLTFGVLSLLRFPRQVWAGVTGYSAALIGMGVLVTVGIATTYSFLHRLPLPFLADQAVVPFAIFIWARWEINRDPTEKRRLARFLVAIGAVMAMLALVGSLVGVTSLYGISTDFARQAVTLDHPLTLALYLTFCVPLTLSFDRATTQFGLVALLIVAQLLTQSRTGLLLSALAAVYVLLRSRTSLLARNVMILTVPVAVLLAASSTLAAGLLVRFENDLGSGALRSTASDYFFDNWQEYLWIGRGVGANYAISEAAGLQSSLESAFYMYALDFGLVTTLAYFGLFLVQIVPRTLKTPHGRVGGGASAILVFIFVQGYSSVATDSAAGVILWMAGALAASMSPLANGPPASGKDYRPD